MLGVSTLEACGPGGLDTYLHGAYSQLHLVFGYEPGLSILLLRLLPLLYRSRSGKLLRI